MRIGARVSGLLALLLAGCADIPPPGPPPPPTSVDNGQGSEHGNYPTFETGEMHDSPQGPCPVYAWDRPLTGGRQVIRYLSAACPYPGRPGFVRMVDLGSVIIPFTKSPLATFVPEPVPTYPVTPPPPKVTVQVTPLKPPTKKK